MDLPISGLPPVITVTVNDLLPIVQAGVTSQATVQQLLAQVGNVPLPTSGFVNVKGYGAVCDGVTDDIAAIMSALANTVAGTVLIPGNCRISAPILMKSGVDLYCAGILDSTGCSSAVNWTGASVITAALTVQANTNDTVVNVASSAGISTGDYVILENNSFHTFPGTFPGIDSHFSQVIAVGAGTITLNNPVPEVFPIASSQIRKILPVLNANAYVKKIVGAPINAFYMQWAMHNRCSGEVNPIGKNAVLFFSAFGNRATWMRGINPLTNTAPGYGYGGLFDFGGSDNSIDTSYFENTREISVGFSGRRNSIRKNVIVRPFDSGANTHGLGAVDTDISDNIIINSQQYGIAISQTATSGWWPDVGTTVRRNTIIGCAKNGIREQQFDAAIATNTFIEDNEIRNSGLSNTANFNHGIAIYGSGTTSSIVNPTIRRNKIRQVGTAGGIGIYVTGLSAKQTVIDDNLVDGTGGSGIRWDSSGGDHSADGNVLRNIGERGFQSAGNERIILGKRNRVESSTLAAYLNIGTAVPSAGTWKVGDLVWNQIPTAGSPLSWECIAAGTPGTWVATSHLPLDCSATYDPPSLSAGVGATTAISCPGAFPGDFVVVGFTNDLQGITLTAWVSSANVISFRFQNGTAGVLDLASGTLSGRVLKQ